MAEPAKKEATPSPRYKKYCGEIDQYETDTQHWRERARKIERVYKDSENKNGKNKRFNVLWSNTRVMCAALYARDPKPVAERRYRDADPVGRVASEVLERCIEFTLDQQAYRRKMRNVVLDKQLAGRGTIWHRYEPTFTDEIVEEGNQTTVPTDEELSNADNEPKTMEVLDYEEVIPDFVRWTNFGHNIAETWDDVWLVWRIVYLTKDQLEKKFGEEIAKEIPLDYKPKDKDTEDVPDAVKKAKLYECWDAQDRKVCFISKGYKECIKLVDDPLSLSGGFPCPEPFYGPTTTDSLIPQPEYALYQTQALEIENLTKRINNLQKALKVAGVYDASAPELSKLLNEGTENKLIPVERWAEFAEKGGIGNSIDWIPVEQIIKVLLGLYESREQAKKDMYELTGIADVIRGSSDPRETAKAQQIKGQYAVLRISDDQEEVQRFARDSIRIMSEIIAEHFSLETIKRISGVSLLHMAEKQQYAQQLQQQQQIHQQMAMEAQATGQQPPPPPQLPEDVAKLMDEPSWEDVHQLLQNDVLREFAISVETDSTIRTDEEAEKNERIETITAIGQFMERSLQASAMEPRLTPLLGEMVTYLARGLKGARSLEPVIEDTLAELQKPQPPKPDPEIAKLEKQGEIDAHLREIDKQADVETHFQEQEAQNQQKQFELEYKDRAEERQMRREVQLAEIAAAKEERLLTIKLAAETEKQIEIDRHKAEQEKPLQDAEIVLKHAQARKANVESSDEYREARDILANGIEGEESGGESQSSDS